MSSAHSSCSFRAINFLAVLLIILQSHSAESNFWEYAVTVNEHIVFFDKNWNNVGESMHHLSSVVAAAYNEVDDILYFNDKEHPEVSIFALKPEAGLGTSQAVPLLKKTEAENIRAMSYDFLEKTLYWTDSRTNRIYKLDMRIQDPKREIFKQLNERPIALALDLCGRSIYYSINDAPNTRIEKVLLAAPYNDTKIYRDGLLRPNGLTVDLAAGRIYWLNNRHNQEFYLDSATLDGFDNHSHHYEGSYQDPRSVLVDTKFVFWADENSKSVRRINKGGYDDKVVEVANFSYVPEVIISRTNNLLLAAENQTVCTSTLKSYKGAMEESNKRQILQDKLSTLHCLNDGFKNSTTAKCDCSGKFQGDNCEINQCHNFCLNSGDCAWKNERAVCTCKEGFRGERCESRSSSMLVDVKPCALVHQPAPQAKTDLCVNHCLNNGACSLSSKKPACLCAPNFTGSRCETKICSDNFCLNSGECSVKDGKAMCKCPSGITGDRCEILKIKACPIVKCPDALEALPLCNCPSPKESPVQKIMDASPYSSPLISSCKKHTTYIILAVCMTLSLLIMLGIVVIIKRVYKPLRPRIKKKYVVHKSLEPLTSRPTTESCEVIIEDCCNMNICETPCFDPKMLQQALDEQDDPLMIGNDLKPKKCKDDKRELLADMF